MQQWRQRIGTSQTCIDVQKLQSFIPLGLLFGLEMFNAAIQSSKQHLFCLCSSVCRSFSRTPLVDSTNVWSMTSQTIPFFNYAFSQVINILNPLFIHSFLHHFLYFIRKHFMQVFHSIFFLHSGKDLIMINAITGTTYLFTDITITSITAKTYNKQTICKHSQ